MSVSAAGLATLSAAEARNLARAWRHLVAAHRVDQFVRIAHGKYQNSPLGTTSGPSRFSPRDHQRASAFQVLYLAGDTATALYETVIRDRFALMAQRVLAPGDYSGRVAFNISTKATQTVSLIDLTGGRDAMYGVPTDVNGAQNQTHGQHFAEFVYANMPTVDGVLYQSRFTARDCVAVFDRAIGRLQVDQLVPVDRDLVANALEGWNVTVG